MSLAAAWCAEDEKRRLVQRRAPGVVDSIDVDVSCGARQVPWCPTALVPGARRVRGAVAASIVTATFRR